MKKHIYCFAHRQMMETRALALSLPAPEDANAIQIGIMRIQKALIEGTISTKTAGLLLYSMQRALQNVGQVTFVQVKTANLVRDTVSEEEAFSENQRPLTTKDTEGTDENQDLPWMEAHNRGMERAIKPVVWRPTPDMYRTDTPEGREAYEASLRMTITPTGYRTEAGAKSRTAGGGCAARASLKCTPIWDEVECSGIPRQGVGIT
jgi:hypothetical protein